MTMEQWGDASQVFNGNGGTGLPKSLEWIHEGKAEYLQEAANAWMEKSERSRGSSRPQ